MLDIFRRVYVVHRQIIFGQKSLFPIPHTPTHLPNIESMKRDKQQQQQQQQDTDPRFHPMSPDISTWEDVQWETDPKQGGKLFKFITLVEERATLDPKRLTFGFTSPATGGDGGGEGSKALSIVTEHREEAEEEEEEEGSWSHSQMEVLDVGSVEWKAAAIMAGQDLNMSELADVVEHLHLTSAVVKEEEEEEKRKQLFVRMAKERRQPYRYEEVFRPGFVTPQLQSADRYDEGEMRDILNRSVGQARKARTLSEGNLFVALFLPHIALDSQDFYGQWKVVTDSENVAIEWETVVALGNTHVVAMKYTLTTQKEFMMGPLMPVRVGTVHPNTMFAFQLVFEPQKEVWNLLYVNGSKVSAIFPRGIDHIFVVVASESKDNLIHLSRTLKLSRPTT